MPWGNKEIVGKKMDQGLKEFYFFSEFLNRRVFDTTGLKVGKISDLVAERAEPYPMIIGVVVRTRGRKMFIPWERLFKSSPGSPFPRRNSLSSNHPLPKRISFC